MRTARFKLGILALVLWAGLPSLHAQSTAFIYQGQLAEGGGPANGNYDFQFTLLDTNGNPVAGPLTNNPVGVTNGQYTVTLDFGAGPFNGGFLWLQTGARTNGSTDPYTLLSPTQPVNTVPYANIAGAALNVAGSAGSATNFSGGLNGDVTGTQNATVVSAVGGQPAASVAGATVAANAATSANTPNAIVQRDASGNFSAGAITALTLSGDGSEVTNLNASEIASGTLADQLLSTNVTFLDGTNYYSGSNNFAGPVILTNGANQFSGLFNGSLLGSAESATNFLGGLLGDVTGTQGATVVSAVGGQSAASVAGATIAANAATSGNTPNTIVQRDASGNFSAGAITALTLSGDGSEVTNLNASQIASGTLADQLLSTNAAFLDGTNYFSGTNNFAGPVVLTNTANQFSGLFSGTVVGGLTTNDLVSASNALVALNTALSNSFPPTAQLIADTMAASNALVALNTSLSNSTPSVGQLLAASNALVTLNTSLSNAVPSTGQLTAASNALVVLNTTLSNATVRTTQLTTTSNALVTLNTTLSNATVRTTQLTTTSNALVTLNTTLSNAVPSTALLTTASNGLVTLNTTASNALVTLNTSLSNATARTTQLTTTSNALVTLNTALSNAVPTAAQLTTASNAMLTLNTTTSNAMLTLNTALSNATVRTTQLTAASNALAAMTTSLSNTIAPLNPANTNVPLVLGDGLTLSPGKSPNLMTINPMFTNSHTGTFNLAEGDASFNGQYDNTVTLGWNQKGSGGTAEVPGVPAYWLQWEQYFQAYPNQAQSEFHLDFVDALGNVGRPFMFSCDVSNLANWQALYTEDQVGYFVPGSYAQWKLEMPAQTIWFFNSTNTLQLFGGAGNDVLLQPYSGDPYGANENLLFNNWASINFGALGVRANEVDVNAQLNANSGMQVANGFLYLNGDSDALLASPTIAFMNSSTNINARSWAFDGHFATSPSAMGFFVNFNNGLSDVPYFGPGWGKEIMELQTNNVWFPYGLTASTVVVTNALQLADTNISAPGTTFTVAPNQQFFAVTVAAGSQYAFVTNTVFNTNTMVLATLNTDDATAASVAAIPNPGYCTLKIIPPPTGNVAVTVRWQNP